MKRQSRQGVIRALMVQGFTRGLAEDAVQDALLQWLERGREQVAFSVLMRTAQSRARDALRKGGHYVQVELGTGGATSPTLVEDQVEIRLAVERLPEELQQVALLTYKGYSGAEIAARLGCARRTVAYRLADARALLRTWL